MPDVNVMHACDLNEELPESLSGTVQVFRAEKLMID